MTDGEIDGDLLLPEFITRHRINIPRKPGTWEFPSVWVKVNEQDRIVAADEKGQSALSYMVKEGVLELHHGYYGLEFIDLRRYFLRRVDYADSRWFSWIRRASTSSMLSRTLQSPTGSRTHSARTPYPL